MKLKSLFLSVLTVLFFATQAQQPAKAKSLPPDPAAAAIQPVGPAVKAPVTAKIKSLQTEHETVANDPFNTHIYTLGNGLKVFISVNKDAPRIQTLFAVKAGSKFDPAQTTGLAHYLEHMLFKGTNEIGTNNWEKESYYLQLISRTFEERLSVRDEAEKKLLYGVIDSLSHEASKYAIPNEYDKMTTSIGAQGTNAFTSRDMTVYINDIPSNALDKFLKLESDRFQTLVLRLFHTELETVYEEFNISQDRDSRWSDQQVMNALLPGHPYGTQTTIGEGEHLKNPSMVNIHKYFDTYYRPNNMAIILTGDLNPDSAFAMVKKYFGTWQATEIPVFQKKEQPKFPSPIIREYKGPMPEHVYIGFRFNGANTRDAVMVKLVDNILANGEAGLIDLDLVQQQKILQGYSYVDENTDYCIHKFYGEPKQGQSLENVADLLLAEIEKIKKGDFGDWVLPAIIQNMKLQRMKAAETNDGRAFTIMSAFVHDIAWRDWVIEIKLMEKITKEDIIAFVKANYTKSYAVCYKRQGEATVHKVEKPKITEPQMNKDEMSPYKKQWDAMPQRSLTPKFLDFSKDISHLKLGAGGVTFDYIKNSVNKTFSLYYIFDMGTDNIRELGLAIGYLEYLGTDKYTAGELKKEFYKLGLSFGVSSGRDRVYVSLSGLEANLEKGIQLFEHILAHVKADKVVYETMVMDIVQKRANAKKNKGTILYNGLMNYAKYGKLNPFNNVMSQDEMLAVDVEKLTDMIRSLTSYKHKVFYYGNLEAQAALDIINKNHTLPAQTLKDYPAPKEYPELSLSETNVYVCYYPMTQAEVILLGKDQLFNRDLYPSLFLYNDYYGSGLSSIFFQEIREKMALAYSVYSNFGVPQYADESHYVFTYIGTQTDKLDSALTETVKLLNFMPEVPQQFEGAREGVVKTLETDWITRDGIYWAYDRAQKRGLDYDVRKVIYEKAKALTVQDVHRFFDEHVKGKKYTYLVLGNQKDLDMAVLKKVGPVKELSLEELFGY